MRSVDSDSETDNDAAERAASREAAWARTLLACASGSFHACVPLHMVPDSLRRSIVDQPAQISEWRTLFEKNDEAIFKEITDDSTDLSSANANLPVDTRLLNEKLALRLLHARSVQNSFNGLLVYGDNIDFLRNYADELAGQVRLIYLDPPYNTGNKHYSYKDNFNRTDWLAMMRACLKSALRVLAENGSICISIDDSEMPYLRILLDEIVGEKNFVACIAYERSGSAGLGQGSVILNTKEYILIYSLDKRQLNDVGNERPMDREVMRRYSKVLESEGEKEVVEEIETQGNRGQLFRHKNFSIKGISLRDFDSRRSEIESQYMESFERIFRTQNVQKENSFQNDVIARLAKDEFYSLDYVPTRGRYKGTEKTLYYWNGELCAWLKDSSFLTPDGIIKRNKLTDFWSHGEIPKADLANEGGVLFSRSKKPEHLMYRLIALATNPGDLVLDLFLGSATTTAVAHKMGRRWIGIESGDYFFDFPLTRMKRVVYGDQTGASKLTRWQGGGSFAYRSFT